jgi:4-hydroxyphenylpyruvate dioxygenase-like putative hemolysin
MGMTGTGVEDIVQIGLVVRDAAATALQYRKMLGVQDWYLNEVDTQRGKGRRFHHRGRAIKAKALIAWARVGSVELELIEPRDEDSAYAVFLRDKGPGIHHVMFGCADFEASSRRLAEQGVVELAGGELQQTRFKLFDARESLGLICEIAAGGELLPDSKLA